MFTNDFIETMLPFTGTFVSAFFVLLFVAYLIFKNVSQGIKFDRLLAKVQEETRTQRDPWRVYKFAPKKRVLRRAGNRCEWFSAEGKRCDISSELQVDHIYPWAAGGWTLEDNAQVLCAAHHLIKGGLVPDEKLMERIQKQRESYFPNGVPTQVRWQPTDEERASRLGKLKPGSESNDSNPGVQ